MLLVAIPKSASTSIMSTIGELHKIDSKQITRDYRNSLPTPSTNYLHNLHGDIREFTPSLIEEFKNSRVFYKQHIYPSENNRNLLQNIKKVVLLREPTDIIKAYQRGVEKGIHKVPLGFRYGMKEDEWIKKSIDIGLLKDLEYFYSEWKKQDGPNTLIINFEEFMNSKTSTINKIEDFFEFKVTPPPFEIHKKRSSNRRNSLKYKMRLWCKKKFVNFKIFMKSPY